MTASASTIWFSRLLWETQALTTLQWTGTAFPNDLQHFLLKYLCKIANGIIQKCKQFLFLCISTRKCFVLKIVFLFCISVCRTSTLSQIVGFNISMLKSLSINMPAPGLYHCLFSAAYMIRGWSDHSFSLYLCMASASRCLLSFIWQLKWKYQSCWKTRPCLLRMSCGIQAFHLNILRHFLSPLYPAVICRYTTTLSLWTHQKQLRCALEMVWHSVRQKREKDE